MAGSSQAVLVSASDGHLYVAKLPDYSDGPNVLFNENVGYEIYRSLGLPVPDWTWLSISACRLDGNREDWNLTSGEKWTRPREGLCFGSRLLGAPSMGVYEILPASMFRRLVNREDFWLAWVTDVLARHADHRQAVFVQGEEGLLRAVFIDHDGLLGGPDGSRVVSDSERQHLDRRIYTRPAADLLARLVVRFNQFDSETVWQRIEAIPDEWKTLSALREACECLNRISELRLVRTVCERLIGSVEHSLTGALLSFPMPEHSSETEPLLTFQRDRA